MPIIQLRDTITITIDNTKTPPQAAMSISRDLPIPQVIAIFSAMIQQLCGQLMAALQQKPPAKLEGAKDA